MAWVLNHAKVALRLKKWSDEQEDRAAANEKFVKYTRYLTVAKNILLPFYFVFTAVNALSIFTVAYGVTDRHHISPMPAQVINMVFSLTLRTVDGLLAAVFATSLGVIWRHLSKSQKTRPSEVSVMMLAVIGITFWVSSVS